ncbi:MAG: HAD family hydrolase [Ruminococcaceae bacterium]|nr:HAD family hydrolase [Oscillospiraceae bacterium]
MQRSELFFDLDGTITHSAEGILNSVTYALERMGLEVPPREQLTCFIGPPLIRSFTQLFGLSNEEGERAVALYREYYLEKGIFECYVFNGMAETLAELRRRGYRLTLATCKPTVMAERILEHFGLRSLFALVSGPELDGTRNEKHEVVAHALKVLNISPDHVLMVGDRRDDVVGAGRCGIPCVGVTWGFGSEEELREAGALSLIHSPEELLSCVESQK